MVGVEVGCGSGVVVARRVVGVLVRRMMIILGGATVSAGILVSTGSFAKGWQPVINMPRLPSKDINKEKILGPVDFRIAEMF
jgi:hypothetical protein